MSLNYVRYEIDYKEVETLEEKFRKLPGNVERIINGYLHVEGVETTTEEITRLIRRSNPWTPKSRHARDSNWSRSEEFNLGFNIKAAGGAANKPGSFGYLVFPNEGRGPRNPLEQRFMERGLDKSVPKIIQGLNDLVELKLREEFE